MLLSAVGCVVGIPAMIVGYFTLQRLEKDSRWFWAAGPATLFFGVLAAVSPWTLGGGFIWWLCEKYAG